jgi:hypothetical protein
MAVSLALWAALSVVPFLPVTGGRKAALGVGVFVAAEVTFWLAAALLGKELFQKYRDKLNPANWFRKK